MSEEWGGVCPVCFAEIPVDAVSADGNWGVCRNCDGVFPLFESAAIPKSQPRPERVTRMEIVRNGDDLVVQIPPVRGKLGGLFLFCSCFMSAFVAVIFLIPEMPLTARLILGSILAFFDLLMLYCTLRYWAHHRRIVFGAEQVQIEGRLFFLRSQKTIPRSRLWGLRSDWGPTQIGNVYNLQLAYDKTSLEFPSRSQEEQLWATSEINGYLDATAGERLCCPACNRGVPDEASDRLNLNARRCPWCGATFEREDAARIGIEEIDSPWRSAYDLLRPLDSPTRVEQTDDELVAVFGPRGVQNIWEKLGILIVLLLGLSIVPEVFFLFHPVDEVKTTAGGLLACSVLLFGLFGWVVLTLFWETARLRITRDEIFITRRHPLLKPREYHVERATDALAEPTGAMEQMAHSIRCTTAGKNTFKSSGAAPRKSPGCSAWSTASCTARGKAGRSAV